MDLGNVLMWSVIAVICIVPFVIMSRNAQKEKQKSRQALQDFAAEHNASIDQEDHWMKIAIGLDEKQGLLFFLSELHGTQDKQWVNLSEIQKCTVSDSSRMVSGQKVVDKIELLFSIRGNQNSVALEFFNVSSGNLTPTIEFQLAEKWSKIANAHLAIAK